MNDINEIIGGFAAEEEARLKAEAKAKKAKAEREAGQKAAMKEIEALQKKAYATISEAEKIADKYNIMFDFELTYGMGGTYHPPRPEGEEQDEDTWYSSNVGWVSSSAMC